MPDFNWHYQHLSAKEFITNKAHYTLNRRVHVASNLISLEMDAAAEMGLVYDPELSPHITNHWFDLPRPTRILKVCQLRLKSITANVVQYDEAQAQLREREARKPLRGNSGKKRR